MAKQHCIHGEENCNRCAINEVEAPTVHLHILLDISTSMCGRWSQTISGLNEYIEARRLDETPYKVTITQFGLEKEVIDLYTEANLDDIRKFDAKKFYPNGSGTALWGAVGISLKKINTSEPVLFIVITDGEENSSHSYSSEAVDKLIDERQKLNNYTFAYLGVDKAAWGQESQVRAFAASHSNVTKDSYGAETYRSLSAMTASYSSAMHNNSLLRSAGHHNVNMSVTNLFSPEPPAEDETLVATVTSANGTVAPGGSGGWQTGE